MSDREKLIELIEEVRYCPRYSEDFHTCTECEWLSDDDCTAARIADHLISNGVTMQKWIPVSERLPEPNEDGSVNAVLVTNGFVIHMAYFNNKNWWFCESGQATELMFYVVTHWMPLPEPPKECE